MRILLDSMIFHTNMKQNCHAKYVLFILNANEIVQGNERMRQRHYFCNSRNRDSIINRLDLVAIDGYIDALMIFRKICS
jgi:hypothetical protein